MANTLTTNDFEFIRDLVRTRSAIVLEDNKGYLVEARLELLMRKLNITSLNDLIKSVRVNQNSQLADQVINAMTTNETSFFRDSHPFEMLKKEIIPNLIKEKQKEKTLKIWCGAASSGQEPYTIAMILKEHFAKELDGWSVSIIATDLSTDILSKAKSGVYSQLEVNRGLPAIFLVKYFEKKGLEWEIKPDVRNLIDFKIMNLIGNWIPMSNIDIVFLRNVLIYFDQDTKKNILNKISKIIQPDGYLFLGSAETLLNLNVPFERISKDASSYYSLQKRG